MNLKLAGVVLLVLVAAFYLERRHDYFDLHGSFQLTMEESDRSCSAPGWVAQYVTAGDSSRYPSELFMQRGIIHSNGVAYYTESAFLDLGASLSEGKSDTLLAVWSPNGVKLCERADRTGGYALIGTLQLPDTLYAQPGRSSDTLVYTLKSSIREFPSESPLIPWWHEQLLILSHD